MSLILLARNLLLSGCSSSFENIDREHRLKPSREGLTLTHELSIDWNHQERGYFWPANSPPIEIIVWNLQREGLILTHELSNDWNQLHRSWPQFLKGVLNVPLQPTTGSSTSTPSASLSTSSPRLVWQRRQRLQVQRVTSVEQGVSTSAQEDLTRVIIFDWNRSVNWPVTN